MILILRQQGVHSIYLIRRYIDRLRLNGSIKELVRMKLDFSVWYISHCDPKD